MDTPQPTFNPAARRAGVRRTALIAGAVAVALFVLVFIDHI
ncbi:MAG TPA: hypothetical protein VFJ04_00310 [Rhodanobacteraceae bacterium]|nr:hypothetical protein [Rhodanobacteraceae bacterium]